MLSVAVSGGLVRWPGGGQEWHVSTSAVVVVWHMLSAAVVRYSQDCMHILAAVQVWVGK